MPAPYDKSKKQLLQSLIKNCDEPSPNWPEYDIEICGRAGKSKFITIYIKKLHYYDIFILQTLTKELKHE